MPRLFIGLISGTSMDGIDAALVDLAPPRPTLLAHHCHPYPPALRETLLKLLSADEEHRLEEILQADVQVGLAFADAVDALLQRAGVDADEVEAMGSHGQTVFHAPEGPFASSWQLGDPNRIAEASGITVVADLRRRDMAAGGEGAPLVPAFHAAVLADPQIPRVILNIGGIANVTILNSAAPITGFDTGPGNTLMDLWSARHRENTFDDRGQWAAGGEVLDALLEALLEDAYFQRTPPKSTGREYFNLAWLSARQDLETLQPQDVQATLCELSARSIADAITAHAPRTTQVLVCGGGVHNDELMRRLRARLADAEVLSTDALGIAPDWVEAMAFAWLAKQTLEGKAGNVPGVTGARHPVVLGGIYPGAGPQA
jgi:anhydro-N-acetylmuramic acid kinase